MRLGIEHKRMQCADVPRISTFIERASLEAAVLELLDQSPFSLPAHALAHIILALGAHILASGNPQDTSGDFHHDPLVYFHVGLKLKPQIQGKYFSTRDFQASQHASFCFASLQGLTQIEGPHRHGILCLAPIVLLFHQITQINRRISRHSWAHVKSLTSCSTVSIMPKSDV